ncbi:hypothetical protein D3C87_1555600 [compost metagenome]
MVLRSRFFSKVFLTFRTFECPTSESRIQKPLSERICRKRPTLGTDCESRKRSWSASPTLRRRVVRGTPRTCGR